MGTETIRYSLAEIIYEYNTDDEGQRGCQRDSADHFHENHQYIMYREDGGRRRCVLTDTGDELVYSQWQPGLQLEEGNWREDYNNIRPSQSSIRDEAYQEWYETTHPRPYTLDGAIEYWIKRRRQLQRCQANHPLSYEAFLRANQPAEGHPHPSPSRAGLQELQHHRGRRRRQLPYPSGTS